MATNFFLFSIYLNTWLFYLFRGKDIKNILYTKNLKLVFYKLVVNANRIRERVVRVALKGRY